MNAQGTTFGAAGRVTVAGLGLLLVAGCATHQTPLQISVFPPAQLVSESTEVNGLRLDVPCGVNGVVRGLDIGVMGCVTGTMTGVQLNVLTASAAELWGAQIGVNPVLNVNEAGRMRGLQVAFVVLPFWVGFSANAANDMKGIQISTLGNIAGHLTAESLADVEPRALMGPPMPPGPPIPPRAKGAQVSFYYNSAAGDASLLQVALGGLNTCGGDFAGAQAAPIGCNYVEGEADGLQVMFIGANVARETFGGIQLGAVNWARCVNGLQVGVLNYCEELHGVQIGAVNICAEQSLPFLPILNVRF